MGGGLEMLTYIFIFIKHGVVQLLMDYMVSWDQEVTMKYNTIPIFASFSSCFVSSQEITDSSENLIVQFHQMKSDLLTFIYDFLLAFLFCQMKLGF
jgi:hypothetical protein